jgi:DNA-binding IclR family transcriptional regulator
MPNDFVTWRARTMRWFAERPGYHADKEARAAQSMKADLWASTTTYLVRHGFLSYVQGDGWAGWTATPKLLALAGKAEPRLAEPTEATLDDVRTPAGQGGKRPSEARLKERLRVLTYLRAKRRGTLAGLVAACETPESMARRHLRALQCLGHVKTDLVTWEVP